MSPDKPQPPHAPYDTPRKPCRPQEHERWNWLRTVGFTLERIHLESPTVGAQRPLDETTLSLHHTGQVIRCDDPRDAVDIAMGLDREFHESVPVGRMETRSKTPSALVQLQIFHWLHARKSHDKPLCPCGFKGTRRDFVAHQRSCEVWDRRMNMGEWVRNFNGVNA